jgi:hypothetical protein
MFGRGGGGGFVRRMVRVRVSVRLACQLNVFIEILLYFFQERHNQPRGLVDIRRLHYAKPFEHNDTIAE